MIIFKFWINPDIRVLFVDMGVETDSWYRVIFYLTRYPLETGNKVESGIGIWVSRVSRIPDNPKVLDLTGMEYLQPIRNIKRGGIGYTL